MQVCLIKLNQVILHNKIEEQYQNNNDILNGKIALQTVKLWATINT